MSAWTETEVRTIDGWEVRATTLPDHTYLRVRAVHRRRGFVFEVPKISAQALETWSPEAAWKESNK